MLELSLILKFIPSLLRLEYTFIPLLDSNGRKKDVAGVSFLLHIFFLGVRGTFLFDYHLMHNIFHVLFSRDKHHDMFSRKIDITFFPDNARGFFDKEREVNQSANTKKTWTSVAKLVQFYNERSLT